MSASVERTVTVRITDDAQAVSEFLTWQMAEDIYPIRGTVTAGLGGYFGTFDGDDERDLMHYFATRQNDGRSTDV